MGGADITDAVAERLGVPADGGRGASSRPPGWRPSPAQVDPHPANRAIESTGGALVEEVRGSLDYYLAQPGAVRIGRVVLSGGGSRLGGLAERLSAATRLPGRAAPTRCRCCAIGRTGLTDEQLAIVEPLVTVPGRPRPGGGVMSVLDDRAAGARRAPRSCRAVVLPRVNLLPPEIAERARLRRAPGRPRRRRSLADRRRRRRCCTRAPPPTSATRPPRSAAVTARGARPAGADRASTPTSTRVYAQADEARAMLAAAMGEEVRFSQFLDDLSKHGAGARLAHRHHLHADPVRGAARAAPAAGEPASAPSPSPASASGTTTSPPGSSRSPRRRASPTRTSPTRRPALIGDRTTVTFTSSVTLTADALSRPLHRPGGQLTWTRPSSGSPLTPGRCARRRWPAAGSCSSRPTRRRGRGAARAGGSCRRRRTPSSQTAARGPARQGRAAARQAGRARPRRRRRIPDGPALPDLLRALTAAAASAGVELVVGDARPRRRPSPRDCRRSGARSSPPTRRPPPTRPLQPRHRPPRPCCRPCDVTMVVTGDFYDVEQFVVAARGAAARAARHRPVDGARRQSALADDPAAPVDGRSVEATLTGRVFLAGGTAATGGAATAQAPAPARCAGRPAAADAAGARLAVRVRELGAPMSASPLSPPRAARPPPATRRAVVGGSRKAVLGVGGARRRRPRARRLAAARRRGRARRPRRRRRLQLRPRPAAAATPTPAPTPSGALPGRPTTCTRRPQPVRGALHRGRSAARLPPRRCRTRRRCRHRATRP